MRETQDKYKRIRDWFDIGVKIGDKGLESARSAAQRAGIDPALAEYDFWTSQDSRIRRSYIENAVGDKSGVDRFDILLQLRKDSPGTGKALLTNDLINDFEQDGVLSKEEASVLQKIKTNAQGELVALPIKIKGVTTGTSGRKKTSIKIPKLSLPKIKGRRTSIKIPKLKLTPIKLPALSTTRIKTGQIPVPKLKLQPIVFPKSLKLYLRRNQLSYGF